MRAVKLLTFALLGILIIWDHSFAIIKTPNLVGAWRFEGNANDWSGNGNNGTVTGATLATGKFGQGYSFDGVANRIDLGSPSSLSFNNTSFTVSAWVKLAAYTDDGADEGIVADYRDVESRWLLCKARNSTGKFQFGLDTNGSWAPERTATGTTTPALNTWYHVVGVYDHSTGDVKIYVNGALENTTSGAPITIGAVNNVTIGDWYTLGTTRAADGAPALNGLIDEVRIYNRALNEAEVRALMLNYDPGEF